ncbi:vad-4 [Anaeramoeba flamelloides]|uniref:Vad-4 n=1 Tax=Anaeramoeba flamelloides TaxID=1746091 RepID=A0AAV7YCV0_9EUKA|nr:vad-4 [Anaeramoeba flamelloides]
MDRTTLKLESHFGTGFRFTKCCQIVDRFENLASLLTGLEFARVVLHEEDLDLDKLYSESCITFLTLTCIFCPSKYIQLKQAGVEVVQNVENLTTYQNLLKNNFSVRDKCLFEISLVNKEKSELWKLFRTLFMLKDIIEKEGSKQVIYSESSSSSLSFSDNKNDDDDNSKSQSNSNSNSNSNSDSDNEFNSKKKNKIQKKDIRIISSLNKELPKALKNLKKIKKNVYENSFYFRKQGLLKRNEPTLIEKEINEAKTKLLNKLLKIDFSKSDSASEETEDENKFEEFIEKKFNKVALSICNSDQLEFFKNHFSPDILPLPVNWFEVNENEVSEDEKSNNSNDSDDKVETSDDNDNDNTNKDDDDDDNSKSQSNSNSNSNSKSNDDTSNSDSNKNSDNNSTSSGEKSQKFEGNSENSSQENSELKQSTSSSSVKVSDSNKKKKPTKKEKIGKLKKRIEKEKDEQRQIEKKIHSSLKIIKKKEKKIANTKKKIEKKKDVFSKVFLEEIHYHPKSSYLSEKSLPLLLRKIEKNINIKIQNDQSDDDKENQNKDKNINKNKSNKKETKKNNNNNEEMFNRDKIKIIGQLENFFYLNYYDKWIHIDKHFVDNINISEDLKISKIIQHLLKQFEESYKNAITLSHFGYFEEEVKVSYNYLKQKNTPIMDAQIKFSKKFLSIDFANRYYYLTNWGNHIKIYLDKNNLKWIYLIDTKEKKLFNIQVSNETLRRTIVFLLLIFKSTSDKLNLIGHNPKAKYYDSQSISKSTIKTTKTAIHRKLLPYLATWANDESYGAETEEQEKNKKLKKTEGKAKNKKKSARGYNKDEFELEKIEKIETDLQILREKIMKFDHNKQVVFGVSIQSGRTVPIESGWLKVDSSGIYIGSARSIKVKKDIKFDENFDISDNSGNSIMFNINGISHSDHKRIQRAKQKSKSTLIKKFNYKKIFNPKQENLHLAANSKRERDLIIITTFFFYKKSRIHNRQESDFEKIFEKLESLLIKFNFKYIPPSEPSQSTQKISSDSSSSSSSSEKAEQKTSSEMKKDSSSESGNDWEFDSDDPIHDSKKIEKYIEDSQDDQDKSENKSNQSDMNENLNIDDEDNEKYSDKNEYDDDDVDEIVSEEKGNDDSDNNNNDDDDDDENEDEKNGNDLQIASSRSSSSLSSKSENEEQKNEKNNSDSKSNTHSSGKSSNQDEKLSGMNINKDEFLDVINENNSSSESDNSTNSFKSSSSLSD